MGKRIPLMLMSDAVSAPTGLARITRELAIRIHKNLSDTFEVATFGYGGGESKQFPFFQYSMTRMEAMAPLQLPKVWRDFAGDRKGVLFTIFNPSWLSWLSNDEKLAPGPLKDFLRTEPFQSWAYCPIDAEGPNGKLPSEVAEIMSGFDRTLCYTQWALDLYQKTTGLTAAHLPHGTDTHMFYPRDRHEMRKTFIQTVTGGPEMPLKDDVFLIGCVATNSARKDWNLCFEVCQELLDRGVNVGLWAHTNALKKVWDIVGLAKAYGMEGRIIPSILDLSDEQMAEAYCACDVINAIGLGEGWGLVASDSLACGVPVVTGAYAGSAEFVPKEFQVEPVEFYGEGLYANKRPVFSVEGYADAIEFAAGKHAELPAGLSWDECWPEWEKWLLDGING